jgi:hypothetical protein
VLVIALDTNACIDVRIQAICIFQARTDSRSNLNRSIR